MIIRYPDEILSGYRDFPDMGVRLSALDCITVFLTYHFVKGRDLQFCVIYTGGLQSL
jgi:hypothetical protein